MSAEKRAEVRAFVKNGLAQTLEMRKVKRKNFG